MTNQNKYKLFIPGPINISDETFKALCSPMIGHRSNDFKCLYQEISPLLQKAFYTSQPVLLSTSSAWGVMEAGIRNLVNKKVLNLGNGAFSDKWYKVSQSLGKEAKFLSFAWGKSVDPSAVKKALNEEHFDAVTLVHNETSTGVENPIKEISDILKDFPDTLFIVDTVSSFSATKIPMDELEIDLMLTGSQKALALPPGLALFALSNKAIERAKSIKNRGYYFDFIEFLKNYEKFMTPTTPSISLIFALKQKLEEMFEEGLENRYKRHLCLNKKVHNWVKKNSFSFFAPEKHRSKSLTCIKNNREIDVPKLTKLLKENHHIIIDGGYGKIKGKTFRLSNMGNETEETIEILLDALDDSINKLH